MAWRPWTRDGGRGDRTATHDIIDAASVKARVESVVDELLHTLHRLDGALDSYADGGSGESSSEPPTTRQPD